VSVSISKEVRKGDGREVGKKGGWERGGKVEGDDGGGGGGGGGGERGTRDEVRGDDVVRARTLEFHGGIVEEMRGKRAQQSRAEQGRGDKTRGTRNGNWENGEMAKRQGGKSAAMMYNVDRTGITRGGV